MNRLEYGYGPHLIMEAYDAETERISDINFIYNFLDITPSIIGMNKILPPHIQRYSEPPDSKWGITGFVIIAESHISIHTYPEKNFFALDIFSCKEFDLNKSINYICDQFKVTKYDHRLLNRGAEFPKDIQQTIPIVKSERKDLSDLI